MSPVSVSPHRPATPVDNPLDSACQFMSPELPAPRRRGRLASESWGHTLSLGRLAITDAGTIKFRTRPQSPAQLIKTLSDPPVFHSMQGRESMTEKHEGPVKSRMPVPSTSQAGTSLRRDSVRTLLQDLNANPDITMRSILDLSRDNHHGDRILRCNCLACDLQRLDDVTSLLMPIRIYR